MSLLNLAGKSVKITAISLRPQHRSQSVKTLFLRNACTFLYPFRLRKRGYLPPMKWALFVKKVVKYAGHLHGSKVVDARKDCRYSQKVVWPNLNAVG
jgi:hypothetical protein